ncbi:hypothetical protein BGZ83_011795 [Gryganskiella cystojenkinii]|nr:hypothetical protein BGZ83_011795 [Gryganskiella cystojenkinii]
MQAHTNFTNEPLVMVVSGAVAFIYALWAVLNHRRQPEQRRMEQRRWAYLHGIVCLFVCAVLVAGSTLGLVLLHQGVLCNKIGQAVEPGATPIMDNVEIVHHYPSYNTGQRYREDEICRNTYSEMDRACYVIGYVAAMVWVIDFCLIIGFCWSTGRYGEHREYDRRGQRGQFGPDDPEEDDFPAGGHTLPGGGGAGGGLGFYGEAQSTGNNRVGAMGNEDDLYYDVQERKRGLNYDLENRTRDDPQMHVQGPIPMSMQQYYFSGVKEPATRSSASPRAAAAIADANLVQTTLSPPPRPRAAILIQPQDSPTLPIDLAQEKASFTTAGTAVAETESNLPSTTLTNHESKNLPSAEEKTGHVESVAVESNTIAPDAPLHSYPATSDRSQPKQQQQQQDEVTTLLDPSPWNREDTGADLQQQQEVPSSTASSPRYVVFPPGPACYVFDSDQHEYLPSFVNVAARIEQKHLSKRDGSESGNVTSTAATIPLAPLHAGAPPRVNSPRVVVTGLGLEAVTRDDTEIAAEEEQEAKENERQKLDLAVPTSITAATTTTTTATTKTGTKIDRPRKINLPKSNSFGQGSYSSAAATPNASWTVVTPSAGAHPLPALASPTASLKSFTSSKSATTTNQRSSGPVAAAVTQHQQSKKPSLKKLKSNSRLSIVTMKNIQQQQQQQQPGDGPSSTSSSAVTSPGRSGQTSPRSPYVGDF